MNIFYSIIIYPIVQIIKITYVLVFKIFEHPGISILGVSFAVTFLCLPLYVIAEKWQDIERETTKKLKPGFDKIKAVFKGDEQYMILSTYYRQNHYHPIFALRSSMGILIQIPFFIAAYSYLSHLSALKNIPFLFIKDLGYPDAFCSIAGFSINILPVAMTLINCASGFIYTKNLASRDKLQVYGIAAVFLVLLYNAPSGLVLYWTMNNILSLLKNIFYKLKNPLRVLYCVFLSFAIVFSSYILFVHNGSWKKKLFLCLISLFIVLVPFIVKLFNFCITKYRKTFENQKQRTALFIFCCTALVILSGMAIPSVIIKSSPQEFSFIDSYNSPLSFLFIALFQALGIFLFWPLCIYFLFKEKIKTLLTAFFFMLVISSVINVFAFSGDYGVISNTFLFDTPGVLAVSKKEILLNIAVIFILFVTALCVLKKIKVNIIAACTGVLAFSLLAFSILNTIFIHKAYSEFLKTREDDSVAHQITPVFNMAKDKPNVVVIMIDGAISGYLEPVFSEHPELREQFDGFTFYPNTVSFASHTLIAVPAIWGGYEYTPLEINRRHTIPLVTKHNEALFVLPTLFSNEGYSVTLSDPSWSNYSLIPDITIFKGYENIQAVNLIGKYRNLWNQRNNFREGLSQSQQIINNLIWFSFLKMSPLFSRREMYDDGSYWSGEAYTHLSAFLDSFSALDFFPELTRYDSEKPSALFITNETTHDSVFLQPPVYRPANQISNTGSGPFAGSEKYHSNNAFYLEFGKWLKELKSNGVYDNTRIIIVADHGAGVDAKLPAESFPIYGERLEMYNPLLMVKDFNAHGELRINNDFMTNADVPVLAVRDLVENPANPFTGALLTTGQKNEGVFITNNHLSMAHHHGKNTFSITDDQWFYVSENIFYGKNWQHRNPNGK